VASVYVLLPRDTFHGYDAYRFLAALERNELDLPTHPLALHVASAWAELLNVTGLGLHDRMRVASALSTGLASAILAHAAWTLLRSKRQALAATAC
jgi:hypothetical protein